MGSSDIWRVVFEMTNMSILIKDMNIPSSCSDCPLNYDMMSCIITGTRWWSDRIMLMDFDCDNERLYDCPLIEVPTPHGRLIDADKLLEKAYWDYNEATHDYNNFKVVSEYDIADAPTVIKAEG